jgi:hypothetical protein
MPFEFEHHQNPPEPPEEDAPWWHHPPKDVETALYYVQTRAFKLTADDEEGVVLRSLVTIIEEAYELTAAQIRDQYPLAFFKPSYEQSLLLNAWVWGIDFVVCFAANRIGKTASLGVVNPCLWIFPNNPDWEMFHPIKSPNPADEGATFVDNIHESERFYVDRLGRKVQLLQRPPIENLDIIRATLKAHPELVGDPQLSHLDESSGNAAKFARLQQIIPHAFLPAWPSPAIKESGTIWLGAPDNGFHKDIVLKEWKRWLPKRSILKWSDSELFFDVRTDEDVNQNPTEFSFICKSYESEDTKWSGSAVTAIILTEGFVPAVLNEIRQRIKVHGFASWDYTPYEARNIGGKTALAFKVYKGEEQLPLTAHIFTRFSARNAPAHILPTSKRDDLIRMWHGKKEGEARLDGLFYSTSPQILSRLDRPFHCVPWTFAELQERYPNGQLYRGFDPGYDHPSVCCWGMLVPGNMWFIYRYYVERQKTISERVADIIRLSGNKQKKNVWGKGINDFTLQEVHPHPHSEPIVLTATDYHMFQADEVTGQPYSLNYIKEGLNVVESTHMRPEDRALEIDRKLSRSEYHVHPITKRTPGAQIFFLINGDGVDMALGKMESLFWDRLASGPNKGEAKDKVPTHKDDELDATCYLVCGPYVWTNYQPPRISAYVEQERFFDPYTRTYQPAFS